MWSIDGKNSKRIRSIRGSALVHINYIIRYYIQAFTMYLLFVIIIVFTTIKHSIDWSKNKHNSNKII